jgi:hypothetical protein
VLIATVLAATFLNGANVDGLRGQTFEKCRSVRVDEKGDVHLDCPGYHVEGGGAGPNIPVAGASLIPSGISKRYFLVTEQSDGAAAQYDVDVYVNSKWLRRLRSGEEQIVVDITRYLQPGKNKLLFAATKQIAGRKPGAAGSFLRIVVGEGESSGAQVLIDNPIIDLRRTAVEVENVNEEFTLQAR